MLQSLGFIIHLEKIYTKTYAKIKISRLCPKFQNYYSHLKRTHKKIIKLLETIIKKQYITLRELTQFLEKIVATYAVISGPLRFRAMETLKIPKLKENKLNFDAKIAVNEKSQGEIKWW